VGFPRAVTRAKPRIGASEVTDPSWAACVPLPKHTQVHPHTPAVPLSREGKVRKVNELNHRASNAAQLWGGRGQFWVGTG
jgi:hypothetical protein